MNSLIRFKVLFALVLFVNCANDESNKTFVATNDWKVIEDGQEIPAGLYVRINMKTGKKEAKLIDANEKPKGAMISVAKEDEVKKKFRSYEEIKQELKDMNMDVKSDIQILMELVVDFGRTNKTEKILTILDDLEYLIHQYDNANQFIKINGLTTVVLPALNNSNYNIRLAGLKLFGSAAQSHPHVQKAAVESDFVEFLLRLISRERDSVLRGRALYALSCLLRSFPQAQRLFYEEAGMSTLASIFDDKKYSTSNIQLKIITLITDLFIELQRNQNRTAWYTGLSLKELMEEGKWCPRISTWYQNLLKSMGKSDDGSFGRKLDHDAVEKGTDLLLALGLSCMEELVIDQHLIKSIDTFIRAYDDLLLEAHDDGDSGEMYEQLIIKLKTLLDILLNPKKYHDEL